jgi:hypothetical protein
MLLCGGYGQWARKHARRLGNAGPPIFWRLWEAALRYMIPQLLLTGWYLVSLLAWWVVVVQLDIGRRLRVYSRIEEYIFLCIVPVSNNYFLRCSWCAWRMQRSSQLCRHDQPTPSSPQALPSQRQRF